MSLGHWFLVGSLLSFAGMGVVHKLGDRYQCNPLTVALFTMCTAALFTAIRATVASAVWFSAIPMKAILLALPFGMCASIALWLFQKGLRHGRIVTSWLLINLSTAIPTLLSVVVYGESLNARKLVTLVLIIASLLLLWWDRRTSAALVPGE